MYTSDRLALTQALRQRSIITEVISSNDYASGIVSMAEAIRSCSLSGGKVICFGNGGSSAQASHFVAELLVRYKSNSRRKPVRAISLTSDAAVVSALANDYSYDELFSRQIECLVEDRDVAIGFSTSGKSVNFIKSLEVLQDLNIPTFLLVGRRIECRSPTVTQIVPSLAVHNDIETAISQEIQLVSLHLVCELLET
jgi:phosphoheptose isomerase